jgi:NAD(P)H-dependent FMN reductase
MQLLAISGSLRAASSNTALLRSMSRCLPPDCQLLVYDELGALPIFSPDREGEHTPPVVERLGRLVAESDGLVVASPEYVHGIPGGLKNLFDWLTSRFEIVDKPIMVVHASHRGDIALRALLEVLSTLSKNTVPQVSIRIPLLSLSPVEVDAVVMRAEIAQLITAEIERFVGTFRRSNMSDPMLVKTR